MNTYRSLVLLVLVRQLLYLAWFLPANLLLSLLLKYMMTPSVKTSKDSNVLKNGRLEALRTKYSYGLNLHVSKDQPNHLSVQPFLNNVKCLGMRWIKSLKISPGVVSLTNNTISVTHSNLNQRTPCSNTRDEVPNCHASTVRKDPHTSLLSHTAVLHMRSSGVTPSDMI